MCGSPLSRRWIVALLLGASALRASEPTPPPPSPSTLAGEFSGKFSFTGAPDMPPIEWRVVAGTDASQGAAIVTANAPGLAARVEVETPAGGGPVRWRVVEANVEVARWLKFALGFLNVKALPPDLEAAGSLRLSGEGTLTGSVVDGRLSVLLPEAQAASAAGRWEVAGVSLAATVVLHQGIPSLETAVLRVARGSVGDLSGQDFEMDAFGGAGFGVPEGLVEVRRLRLGLLGGTVTIDPFRVDPAAPAIVAAADFDRLELAKVAALIPRALRTATGHASGRVLWRWSPAEGFRATGGELSLLGGEAPTITLAPKPGFLTGKMPRTLSLLPAWLGPLARLRAFNPDSPAYLALRRIEMGEIPLSVQGLNLSLYPDGPDGLRSVRADVAARAEGLPAPERGDGGVKVDSPPAVVKFGVNVAGPLEQVLRLGLDERATVQVGAGP